MNELALFAGAGGGILGGHLLGWRTVCAVEWEPYPASVLCARQNDGLLPPFPVWDDIQTFDGKPWRGLVDVVSGGFPCQDISAAGRGAGLEGQRSGMWHHMARVVGEVRPQFVFVENSPMLTSRGGTRVIGDFTEMGYDCRWTVMGAADIGAPHQRDRFWLVARRSKHVSHAWSNERPEWRQQQPQGVGKESKLGNSFSNRWSERRDDYQEHDRHQPDANGEHSRQMADAKELFSNGGNDYSGICMGRQQIPKSGNDCWASDMANAHSQRQQGQQWEANAWETSAVGGCGEVCDAAGPRLQKRQVFGGWQSASGKPDPRKAIERADWWQAEPDVGRVADGVAARVDRLKAIGNGQVPLCAATAWRILND